jgi:cytochrome c
MSKVIRFGSVFALALALAGCGSKPDEAASPPEEAPVQSAQAEVAAPVAAPTASAPAVFAQCRACHAVAPGRHGVGPSLAGVYGTKAGEIPGYAFSAPLKASGLTWDDATLDKWLEGPMKLVPGTRMVFAGQPDPVKRKELVEYLKSLK